MPDSHSGVGPGQVGKLPTHIKQVQAIMAKVQSIKDGDDHEFEDAEWAIAALTAMPASVREMGEVGVEDARHDLGDTVL